MEKSRAPHKKKYYWVISVKMKKKELRMDMIMAYPHVSNGLALMSSDFCSSFE